MGHYEQNLREALFASESAEEKFAKRKNELLDELWYERVRGKRETLPAEIAVLLDARVGKDPICKSQVAVNQWQIQRTIMYSNLELIEQNKQIIDLLTKIVEK